MHKPFLKNGDKMKWVFNGRIENAKITIWRRGKQVRFPLGKDKVSILEFFILDGRESFEALGQFLAGVGNLEYRFVAAVPNQIMLGSTYTCKFVSTNKRNKPHLKKPSRKWKRQRTKARKK